MKNSLIMTRRPSKKREKKKAKVKIKVDAAAVKEGKTEGSLSILKRLKLIPHFRLRQRKRSPLMTKLSINWKR